VAVGLGHLADQVVVVGTGGHLGQVGDCQHLALAAQLLHQRAHGVAYRTADARVDLVEDQRARAILARGLHGGDGNRQRQPRQFTA